MTKFLSKVNDNFKVVIQAVSREFSLQDLQTPGRVQKRLLTKIGIGDCEFSSGYVE